MTETYDFSTPMMQQYLKLKAEYADCILLFRLGDFYEMFLDDAKTGADVLEITLTSRSRGKDGRIPMAGVPHHAVTSYINKLVKAGYKVALCDQVSEPGQGLVERQVTRIITPGTVLDELSLESRQHNYILLLDETSGRLEAAAADLGTGDVRYQAWDVNLGTKAEIVSNIFATLSVSEVLVTPAITQDKSYQRLLDQANVTVYPVSKPTPPKQSLSDRLRDYLAHTQKQPVTHLAAPQAILTADYLQLDPATIANLELVAPVNSRHANHTLLTMLDQTQTAMGGRLLRQWLVQPLALKPAIDRRLASVEWLLAHQPVTDQLTEQLRRIADLERLTARLSVSLGTPRDLRQLVNSLHLSLAVKDLLTAQDSTELRQLFATPNTALTSLLPQLEQRLVNEPPVDATQGGLIAEGYDPELDRLRSLINVSKNQLLELEQSERQHTGINSLKVRFNKVFGFYIEISNSALNKVPAHYVRKQTLVNAERFITPELKTFEEQILTAEEKINALEYQHFLEMVTQLKAVITEIQALARAIAQLDCLLSFAIVSRHGRYTKPTLLTTGQLTIVQGRHPVVERVLPRAFVPNDVSLTSKDQQLILLTGPNMAGKSVLMRQTALIVLMAHLGCFVPAHSAKISLTDRIFVRSGAQDAIAAGMSTFMVEMSEAAYILHHATARSLIVMDEIGRGTSTYDGISIASAIAEFLVHNPTGPKTLFATHYHELQALAVRFPHKIINMHLAVEDHDHQPIFLYTLQAGPASHSFGVAVAKLAKLPPSVVQRAETILAELETAPQRPVTQTVATKKSKFETELKQLNLNQLTPLAALNLLAKWKADANH